MPKVAVLIGALLIVLGVWSYMSAPVEHRSPTALIPAGEGLLLAICGAIAMKPNLRMHAMHVAAMVGTFGLLAALGALIARRPQGIALFSMSAMALLSLIFTVLCVRSFIVARRNRLAGGA
ncbi:MAG TPA: hypothetical protein VL282_06045 [Tepidisphaeraceae bacterium]|jgi:hypothetical protein|nr:hypothetical protein [Tepidisphaeraceae bacterium]